MELLNQFEIVGGSCQGRDHKNANKNSHDAYYWAFDNDLLVAAVTDGCGSGEHSEVGAKIGVRIVVEELLKAIWSVAEPGSFVPTTDVMKVILALAKKSANERILAVAQAMGGSYSKTISNYFLFTVVGAIIMPEMTFTFAAGDGLTVMNGNVVTLDQGSAPNYICYDLVETDPPRVVDLDIVEAMATKHVHSILLGTDGVNFLAKACETKIPGKDEFVGPMSQFWTEDKYFKNPYALMHRLNLINREVQTVDHVRKVINSERGPLMDDTTMVVIRRKTRKD